MHRFDNWRDVLQGAPNEEAVARVMRDYVAAIAPALVSTLPEKCQRALRDPDVQSAAVGLLQGELAYKGSSEIAAVLHEMAHTFAVASLRLVTLRQQRPPPTK